MRVWLLSRKAGNPITLADIEDATFDGLAEHGFDRVWLFVLADRRRRASIARRVTANPLVRRSVKRSSQEVEDHIRAALRME